MKAFAKKDIKFDIISDTSIGAVNGAIIAANKGDNPSEDLENFWLELAESSMKVFPDFHTLDYDRKNNAMVMVKSPSASLNSALFGVPKSFIPRSFGT
jgi:predicted acylesterase/phospholipase RssA